MSKEIEHHGYKFILYPPEEDYMTVVMAEGRAISGRIIVNSAPDATKSHQFIWEHTEQSNPIRSEQRKSGTTASLEDSINQLCDHLTEVHLTAEAMAPAKPGAARREMTAFYNAL